MALREILAQFDVIPNLAPLAQGEAAVDAFTARLGSALARAEGMRLPVNVDTSAIKLASAEIERFTARGGANAFAATLDAGSLQATLAQAERQIAQANLKVLVSTGADVAPAQAELLRLQGAAADTRAALGAIGDSIGGEAATKLAGVEASLAGVAKGAKLDAVALDKLEGEANQAAAALQRLGAVDARNSSLPALTTRLAATKAQIAGMRAPAEQATKAVGGGLMGAVRGLLPALGVGVVARWGAQMVSSAADVHDLSKALSMSAEQTQAWGQSAEMAGASIGDVRTAVKSLSTQVLAARDGSKEAAESFAKLGIDPNAAATSNELLLQTGAALAGVKDEATRNALAAKLMGRNGMALIPIFEAGEDATRAQLKAFEESAAFSSAFAQAADELDDSFMILKKNLLGSAASILTVLMPAIKGALAVVSLLAKQITGSRIMSVGLFAGLRLAGPMLANVARTFFGAFASGSRFVGLLKGAGRFVLRFMLPFLILEDIIVFLNGGNSALGRLLNRMLGAGAANEVMQTTHDIFFALTGAVEALFNLMTGSDPMATLSERQLAGITAMKAAWDDFAVFFADIWNAASEVALGAIGGIAAGLGELLSNLPLIGDSLGGALKAFGNEQMNAANKSGAIDKLTAGFTGGGAGFTSIPSPASVPAPKPAFDMMAGIPQPNINIEFNGVKGSPTDVKAAARTVTGEVGRQLKKSNRAIAKTAGA